MATVVRQKKPKGLKPFRLPDQDFMLTGIGTFKKARQNTPLISKETL